MSVLGCPPRWSSFYRQCYRVQKYPYRSIDGSALAEIDSPSDLEFIVELAEEKEVQLKEVSKSIGGIEVGIHYFTLLNSLDGSMEKIHMYNPRVKSNRYPHVSKTSNRGILVVKDLHTQNTVFSSILFKK